VIILVDNRYIIDTLINIKKLRNGQLIERRTRPRSSGHLRHCCIHPRSTPYLKWILSEKKSLFFFNKINRVCKLDSTSCRGAGKFIVFLPNLKVLPSHGCAPSAPSAARDRNSAPTLFFFLRNVGSTLHPMLSANAVQKKTAILITF
jgi:hypothetical protein